MGYDAGVRAALLLAFGSVVSLHAFEVNLGPVPIADAIALGQTTLGTDRATFHARYRIAVREPPVDFVEVVTPFRQIVLAAEARMRAGERLLGQRDATALLGDTPNQLELRLELTFHPQNAFIGVPFYDVELTSVETLRAVTPARIERVPRFGPRLDGPLAPATAGGAALGAGQPLVGGTMVVVFSDAALDPSGSYVLSVKDGRQVLSRTVLALGDLR